MLWSCERLNNNNINGQKCTIRWFVDAADDGDGAKDSEIYIQITISQSLSDARGLRRPVQSHSQTYCIWLLHGRNSRRGETAEKRKEKVWFVIWSFNKRRHISDSSSRNQRQWYLNKRHYSVRFAFSAAYACAATLFILNFLNSVHNPCLFSAWLEPPTLIDRSTWKGKKLLSRNSHRTVCTISYDTRCNEWERRILGDDEWLEFRSRFHALF